MLPVLILLLLTITAIQRVLMGWGIQSYVYQTNQEEWDSTSPTPYRSEPFGGTKVAATQGESIYTQQDTVGFGYEVIVMPYRWKKKVDVDETIVVIKNVLDETPVLPEWLLRTIHGAIADSEPELGAYFFKEVERYAPSAMKYFKRGAEKIPPIRESISTNRTTSFHQEHG